MIITFIKDDTIKTVHSVEEALLQIEELEKYPVLIIPVPESCSKPWRVAQTEHDIPEMVRASLEKSYFNSVHLISKGGKTGHQWWKTITTIEDPHY